MERFTLNPNLIYAFIDKEAVIINNTDDTSFGLNETAADVLKLLERSATTIKNLSDYILEHYDIDEAVCIADINSLIAALLEKNFVIRVNE